MKRFNFRLDSLLHLREAMEKMQGANLGEAQRAEGARRADADAMGSRLAAMEEQVSGETISAPRAAGLWHAVGLTVDAVRAGADHAAEELRVAEAHRAVELERFNEARAARRVLEKLRERRVADWELEAGRAERSELDEQMSQQIHHRTDKR